MVFKKIIMWKFGYFKNVYSEVNSPEFTYEITEPIEGATIDMAATEDEAIKKVAELNADLADYLAYMSTLDGWKDYFEE